MNAEIAYKESLQVKKTPDAHTGLAKVLMALKHHTEGQLSFYAPPLLITVLPLSFFSSVATLIVHVFVNEAIPEAPRLA